MLPRLQVSKVLVKIYQALENKSIENIRYENKIICIDGIQHIIYMQDEPEFLLATLFHVTKVGPLTWEFEPTTLFDQLVGKLVSANSTIVYLKSRYNSVEERIRHYLDFEINM